MFRPPPLAASCAAGLATLAICAACSSSGSATTASGRTPTTHVAAPAGGAATSTTHATSAPHAGSGKLIDVCAVLPKAKVSQITGTQFTTTKSRTVMNQIAECEYGGGTNLLQVSVSIKAGPILLKADVDALTQVGHAPTVISGVGDQAFSEPDPKGNAGSVGASAFASFGAVFGQTYVKIGGLTYVTADQGKQIAELLHAAM